MLENDFKLFFEEFFSLCCSSAVRLPFLILISFVILSTSFKAFRSICSCGSRRSRPKEDTNGLVKEIQHLDDSLYKVEKNIESFSEIESLISERDGCIFFDGDCSKCNYCHDCHIVEDLKKWIL